MAQIVGDASLVWDRATAMFPTQMTPSILMTDFLVNFNQGNTQDMQGVQADPFSNCATAGRVWVPHNQHIDGVADASDPNYPILSYSGVVTSPDVTMMIEAVEGQKFGEILVVGDPSTEADAAFYAEAELDPKVTPPPSGGGGDGGGDGGGVFPLQHTPPALPAASSAYGGAGMGSRMGRFWPHPLSARSTTAVAEVPGDAKVRLGPLQHRLGAFAALEGGGGGDGGGGYDGSGGYDYQPGNVLSQGVVFLWKRIVTDATKITAAGPVEGTEDQGSTLAFRIWVSDTFVNPDTGVEGGGDKYVFSVLTGLTTYPKIAVSTDDGQTWKVIQSNARPDGGLASILGNTAQKAKVQDKDNPDDPTKTKDAAIGHYEAVEVIFTNFTLEISLAGSSTPYVFPINWKSNNLPVINKIAWRAFVFTELHLSAHLVKWGVDDLITSNPINVGFAPANAPTYRIHGLTEAVVRESGDPWDVAFPEDSQIVVSLPDGVTPDSINQFYDLRIKNKQAGKIFGIPYANLTAAVTRVAIRIPGVWVDTVPGEPEELTLFGHGLKEIRQDISFDMNSRTVHHTIRFTLDNFYGGSSDLRSRWGLVGVKACNLMLGYQKSGALPDPDNDKLTQRFLGYTYRYEYSRPTNSQAHVVVSGTDSMMRLRAKYSISPPDMDGWNHFAAIAFLAQLAGIHSNQMSTYLRMRVATDGGGNLLDNPDDPIDPYSSTDVDMIPYFLPLGIGMHPWSPRNRAMSVMDLIDHVRSASGYMLYFDASAFLRYEPWIPPSVADAKHTFSEAGQPADAGALTHFWDPVVVSDVSDVRNKVLLFGVDSFAGSWRPVIEYRDDLQSIYDPGAFNYLSWESVFAWSDPKFGDKVYASTTADQVMAFMRVPEISANFEGWMQPTLFPMDTVFLKEAKSGVAPFPLYITQMSNLYSVVDGAMRMRSQITGRYITEFV